MVFCMHPRRDCRSNNQWLRNGFSNDAHQIKTLDAAYVSPDFETERIRTLTELTAILLPGVPLALELKADQFLVADVRHR